MTSSERPLALVTGAAVRLGATVARRLHTEGYDVAVHYRRSRAPAAALVEALNGERADSAFAVGGDLASRGGPEALAEAVLGHERGCALLVNNASSFYPTPFGEVEDADWDDLMGSNLRGPFFLTQALAPSLGASGGSVVNIVDIHAERPLPRYPVYSIAKAGLAAMTRSLARELAPAVRVNGVAPGAILWPEDPEDEWGSQQERIVRRIPLRRTGAPDDIAGAVAYLAGADYVSGQVLAVDGGRSLVL